MHIGICDNDRIICQEIRKGIENTPVNINYQIYEFSSGKALLDSSIIFDILFLDIELGEELSGLDIAQELEKLNPDLTLIFISSYTKYVSSSFYFDTFQFLLKPIEPALLQKEFLRCVDKYRNEHAHFTIKQFREETIVEIKNIVYIEARKRKLYIVLNNKKVYEIYGKISEQEIFFNMYNFVKIYRSFLVNLKYVIEVRNKYVILRDQSKLPISRSHKQEVKEKYHKYLLGSKL